MSERKPGFWRLQESLSAPAIDMPFDQKDIEWSEESMVKIRKYMEMASIGDPMIADTTAESFDEYYDMYFGKSSTDSTSKSVISVTTDESTPMALSKDTFGIGTESSDVTTDIGSNDSTDTSVLSVCTQSLDDNSDGLSMTSSKSVISVETDRTHSSMRLSKNSFMTERTDNSITDSIGSNSSTVESIMSPQTSGSVESMASADSGLCVTIRTAASTPEHRIQKKQQKLKEAKTAVQMVTKWRTDPKNWKKSFSEDTRRRRSPGDIEYKNTNESEGKDSDSLSDTKPSVMNTSSGSFESFSSTDENWSNDRTVIAADVKSGHEMPVLVSTDSDWTSDDMTSNETSSETSMETIDEILDQKKSDFNETKDQISIASENKCENSMPPHVVEEMSNTSPSLLKSVLNPSEWRKHFRFGSQRRDNLFDPSSSVSTNGSESDPESQISRTDSSSPSSSLMSASSSGSDVDFK